MVEKFPLQQQDRQPEYGPYGCHMRLLHYHARGDITLMLIDLYNGQTNFDLRLITLELSTQTLLFIDVLSPHYLIVIKILICYMNKGNVPLFMLSLMHQLIYKGICEQTVEMSPLHDI